MAKLELINGIPTMTADEAQKPFHTTVMVYNSTSTLLSNFYFDGTNLLWEGLKLSIGGLPLNRNQIADQTTTSTGLTDLSDGECLVVEPNYDSGVDDTLTVTKATKSSLSNVTNKFILAEKIGSDIVIGPDHSGL